MTNGTNKPVSTSLVKTTTWNDAPRAKFLMGWMSVDLLKGNRTFHVARRRDDVVEIYRSYDEAYARWKALGEAAVARREQDETARRAAEELAKVSYESYWGG